MTQPENTLSTEDAQSRRRAVAVARILDDKKIRDISVLNVTGICSFTDFFVIATAENSTQLKAAEAAVYAEMRDLGVRGRRDDVQYDSTWAIIDYGDVVTHLFLPESREYYRLESLWGDGADVAWDSDDPANDAPHPAPVPVELGLDDDEDAVPVEDEMAASSDEEE